MALICPNLSDNDVAADFQAIVDKTNENIAYNLWNKFEGDIDAIEDFIDAEIAKFTPKPMVSREAFEQSQHDPLINLASKWGLNNEGFSNPSVSHSQLEKEAKELGLGLKKATSGSYYLTKNGKKINPWRDAYQLAKEPGENPVQELQDKLTRWAEDHGIEVTTMEDLIQRMQGSKEYSDGVIGVADIANKLIGLAEGKISIDTLPEEVSHFIVNFMINDPSIQRALEQVVNTDVYQQVKEDYKDIYTTEEQFQKEALGKILAAEIVNQFKGKSTQETGQDQTIYNRVKSFSSS